MNGFADRLEAVKNRIAAACARSGRSPESVSLLAVSKTFGPDAIAEAAAAGQVTFGESRVQEARQKIPLCSGSLEWHMIGHLQRNKVREAAELFSVIHSVDSMRLLEAIDAAAGEAGKRIPVFLEVNVSGESCKFGLRPDAVAAVIEEANRLLHVSVAGFMTVPPFDPDPARTRPFFRRLRELRDSLAGQLGVDILNLSMGMSHDFEAAVEEGATWVRVGTLLFGGRRPIRESPAGE